MTVATPRSGFDLEYYLNRTAGEKTGGGYYMNAAQQGEPDGRWFGKGAEALGLRDGQVVRKEPYLAGLQHGRSEDGGEAARPCSRELRQVRPDPQPEAGG